MEYLKQLKNCGKLKRIVLILSAMGTLATITFNCSPSEFAAYRTVAGGFDLSSTSFEKPNAPLALMTAEQTYQSMLNVTGQTETPVSTNEYALRFPTMSSSDSLANLSAPLLLASTSLAGDVCANLVNKERSSTARQFFTGVNFGAGLDANPPQAYFDAVQTMAVAFWGRELNASEEAIMTSFYSEFRTGSTNNADLTNDLYVGACAAMLSSFDSLVY